MTTPVGSPDGLAMRVALAGTVVGPARVVPDLRAAAKTVTETLYAADRPPERALLASGSAATSVAFPDEPQPLRSQPADDGILVAGSPGQGSCGSIDGTIPKTRSGSSDGDHVQVVYHASGALGPASGQQAFLNGSGGIAAERMSAPDADGLRHYVRIGPTVHIQGSDAGRGLQHLTAGVGARFEAGYASRLSGTAGQTIRFGGYADTSTTGTEGGGFLAIQAGP